MPHGGIALAENAVDDLLQPITALTSSMRASRALVTGADFAFTVLSTGRTFYFVNKHEIELLDV